MREILD